MFTWLSEEYCSRDFFGSGPSFLLNNLFNLTVVEEMVEKQCSFDYFLPSLQVSEAPQSYGVFFPSVCVIMSMSQGGLLCFDTFYCNIFPRTQSQINKSEY